ncbi:MAG: hypothetical protein ACFFB5_20110 [Promethearchaeota archaeon]
MSKDSENDLDFEIDGEEMTDRKRKSDRQKEIGPLPPEAPSPPPPPAPPTPSKVVGIRGLDPQLYTEIGIRAKQLNITVSELINDIFSQYLTAESDEESISGVDVLDISNEDLKVLESIKFIDIGRLNFHSDITRESFKNVKEIQRVDSISIPSHLYLPLLKIVRHCGKIDKYTGESLPSLRSKRFENDITLPREFFQYLLKRGEKIQLYVDGDLVIAEDVTLEEYEGVVQTLRVEGEVTVPKSLVGLIYAQGELYGEVNTHD